MNSRPNPIARGLASILACSLLTACGGGGGGMVRSTQATQRPTTAQTPVPANGPCPMPVNGDCLVTAGTTMLGGRDSSGRLVIRAGGPDVILGHHDPSFDQTLGRGTYRFAAGTVIESGVLYVQEHNTLTSDVWIQHTWGGIRIAGTVNGNISNAGTLQLFGRGVVNGSLLNSHIAEFWGGRINGDLQNSGRLYGSLYEAGKEPRVAGDFVQSPTGELVVLLPPSGSSGSYSGGIVIEGRAQLAGSLLLGEYSDGWGATYPPPAAGSHLLLSAHGGISGRFDRWGAVTPGVFFEGSVRYGPNDVWFDLTRISAAAAMASNGIGSALTLASAGNLDRAFARTDGFALAPPGSLTSAQGRMLTSAGSVLRIADIDQATRTLDSLSGATHADALHSSLQQGIADPAVGQRLAAMQRGFAAGAWSKTSVDGTTSGFDQWLSPRLLVGVQAGQGFDDTRDTFGQSSRLSPQAGAYLRWFGDDGWYAGGSAGYAQHTLALDRTLDLDRGGQWNAHARHRFNVAGVQGEAGRRLSFAGGTLTPYVALDATALRSERTVEQGRTGFELALQPAMQARLGAGLGLRYGRDWHIRDTGWLRLEADARVQRRLADAGDPLRAAFVGVPDLWFDVPSEAARTTGWLDLGLRGGFGLDWTWTFAHARPLHPGHAAGDAWRFGLSRSF